MTSERISDMTDTEIREFDARTTLTRAGFKPDPARRVPLAMLEALAGIIGTWGQDADYPDEPGLTLDEAGKILTEGER